MIPELTASVGAPRVAGIEFPFGRPLGLPGDRAGQRAVLHAALEVVSRARAPGTLIQLPFAWPQPPRDARADPPIPPPIVQLIKHKPWLAVKLLARDIPEPRQPEGGLNTGNSRSGSRPRRSTNERPIPAGTNAGRGAAEP